MQITIIDNNRAKSWIEQNTLIWKLFSKKYLYRVLLSLIFGAILVFIGFISYNDYSTMVNLNKITYINIHLFESIGILILLSSFIHAFRFFKTKKQYFNKVESGSQRYAQKDANVIYININDTSISYQSHFSKIEFVWEAITGYHLRDNLIFLFTSDTIDSTIIIDKNLLSNSDFEELSVFIHSRVKRKFSLV